MLDKGEKRGWLSEPSRPEEIRLQKGGQTRCSLSGRQGRKRLQHGGHPGLPSTGYFLGIFADVQAALDRHFDALGR